MIDLNADSGEIEMRTMAENEMPNPWNESGCTAEMDVKTGMRKILTIEFNHQNGWSYAIMNVVKNNLTIERMDRLLKQDFDDLWKIIIQSLTAKQVPI